MGFNRAGTMGIVEVSPDGMQWIDDFLAMGWDNGPQQWRDDFLAMVEENGLDLERWAMVRSLIDMAADLRRRIEAG